MHAAANTLAAAVPCAVLCCAVLCCAVLCCASNASYTNSRAMSLIALWLPVHCQHPANTP
jgi:hypothetical protein